MDQSQALFAGIKNKGKNGEDFNNLLGSRQAAALSLSAASGPAMPDALAIQKGAT